MNTWKANGKLFLIPLLLSIGYAIGVLATTTSSIDPTESNLSAEKVSPNKSIDVAGIDKQSFPNSKFTTDLSSHETLNEEIQNKNREIRELFSLIDQLEEKNKKLTQEKNDVSMFACLTSAFANGVSDTTLTSLLASSTPFSKEDLADIRDPVGFAVKLSSIVAGNNYDSKFLENPGQYTPTNFKGSNTYDEGLSSDVFPAQQGKIYTHFKLSDNRYDKVLVKWYNPSTNDIMLFKTYGINPSDTDHYIWLSNNKPWDEGRYIVEIYAPDDSLQLLTAGSYYVAN